jgi:hypothetical protein
MASTGDGYWLVAADGGVFSFGDAKFHGSLADDHLNAPVVGMASSGDGYWLVAADGGVFTFGNAGFHGSLANERLSAPIVGIVPFTVGSYAPATSPFHGYWLIASDGAVYPFGLEPVGTAVGKIDSPVTGVGSPFFDEEYEGFGNYGFLASLADGEVIRFEYGWGDAPMYDGGFETHVVLGNPHLGSPVVGMESRGTTSFTMVQANGGVMNWGRTNFFGSLSTVHLNAPVVGITTTTTDKGYWLVAADGGVFTFGDAAFYGSLAG